MDSIDNPPRDTQCFAVRDRLTVNPTQPCVLTISDREAAAWAELIPLLTCGEESAVLTFSELTRHVRKEQRAVMQGVAQDELRHELWLRELKHALPPAALDPALRAATRRFFMSMAARDWQAHLINVVALDSAVCQLLGAVRKRLRINVRYGLIDATLTRIHRDETRHVQIARALIATQAPSNVARDRAAEVRVRLTQLLAHRAFAFEVLHVDADRLFRRLLHVPRALFS